MRTVAVIQARMGSTRLPGKVMMDLAGKPMLARVVNRVCEAQRVEKVVIATTLHSADENIINLCKEHNWSWFRGKEADVLDRYYQAAKHFRAEVIVRLTADCPLLDAVLIDRVIDTFYTGNYDYVSNVTNRTYPKGLDTEVFGWSTLERAWQEAMLEPEREHVTPYMRNHPELFRVANVEQDVDLSHLRWTLDKPEDLEFMRAVYSYLESPTAGMEDVLAILDQYPELSKINAHLGVD